MNKDQLQAKLKEKEREGEKPNQLTTPPLTPPDSPIITPIDKKPSQKPGQEGNSPSPIADNKKIKDLERDVKYWSTIAQNYLSSLQKLTAELDQVQEKIKELQQTKKTISEKEKKAAVIDEIKKVVKPGDKPSDVKRKVIEFKDSIGLTQTQKLYNFACELCEQYRRQERQNFHRLDGLALDPNKLYIICDTCIETGRANIVKERNNEYDPIKW